MIDLPENSPIFEKIYKDYLAQISAVDLRSVAERLGIDICSDEAIIPLFGKPYRVSEKGVFDLSGLRPSHSASVVLFKYLLLCPEGEPGGREWVAFRDFKDAAPFVEGFSNTSEHEIEKKFTGKLPDLEKASIVSGGKAFDADFSYDLTMRFCPLPKVPVIMLFNDEYEVFRSKCVILFEKCAEKYLDMECLAIIGMQLAGLLIKNSK
ncbi:MAG: DUF3786 domain-containing protein [Desulfobacteraceae bacterium]|nr:MAG: DUF3786 domain-containing protein [Desulfobacteraceae bacterium]